MATNRDLLKEAIADAKAVKETAIANAKAALEEAFTPYLKEKLSAKLAEMDTMDEIELDEAKKAEEENEGRALVNEKDKMMKDEARALANEEDMTEEVSLDELLAELDEESMDEEYMDEDLYEAKDEEEMSIEDMSEDDLKSFIEDVIKDMVAAGELEAGESMEDEEMEVDMETGEEELDEEININELLAELDEEANEGRALVNKNEGRALVNQEEKDMMDEIEIGSDVYLNQAETILAVLSTLGVVGAAALASEEIRNDLANALRKGKKAAADFIRGLKGKTAETQEMEEQLNELRNEINEVNLLNAKLLYTNKIFRNKSLTESQKVKVLTSFDKATSKKEVELVYETLMESLKVSTKAPIKESLGSASKVLGGATSKPIIENDAFARMRELAFGGKK